MPKPKPSPKGALVIGGGIAGVQAALDLANQNIITYIVEKSPSLGGRMAQLDKTFPTNDCSMCILSPKLVEASRHPNIQLIMNSEVVGLKGKAGNFKATLKKHPRYILEDKCTGCGECVKACPVELPNEFECAISERKAIYVPFPQAVPLKYTITKRDEPPCRAACPAGINAQGYIALTKVGKYQEALALVKQNIPLPGVLGRICHHPCETACNRAELDEPLAICEIKRFLADHALEHGTEEPVEIAEKRAEKVAIVGAGPAGLTAAANLAKMGYKITIFEALPVAGGMLAVGIPDYRLPPKVLQTEIDSILKLGVKLKLNTRIGKDITINKLFKQGYKAIFLATGAHQNMKLNIQGENLQEVYSGVEFLRDINLGKKPKLGKKVAVIGGGNVAIDSVRTAKRLGADAFIIYRRSRDEMPAYPWEVADAEEEGIKIHYLATPTKILGKNGKVSGLECIKMELG
ncbi:MAG: FAD-dependent oxidoreductase, partial [Thermoplasmata archaeon]|nr:FAD-dependent oxidoreductase [Thermoplasmata archaeon]